MSVTSGLQEAARQIFARQEQSLSDASKIQQPPGMLSGNMPQFMPQFLNESNTKTWYRQPNLNENYSIFNTNVRDIDANVATSNKFNPATSKLSSVNPTNTFTKPLEDRIKTRDLSFGAEDTGGNGATSRAERQAARKADRIVRRDTNGDGTVSGSEFMSSGAGAAVNAAAGVAAAGLNMMSQYVGAQANAPAAQQLDETQNAVRSGLYSAVSAIPVWGQIASAGMQISDAFGAMTGGQISSMSKSAAEDAGLNRGVNNVLATIPVVGSMLGYFTRKADEFEFDRSRVDNIGSAYDMSTFDSADDLSGGKFIGQTDKVNAFIAEQNRKKDIMTGISDVQRMRKRGASSAAADLAQQNRNRYGGITGQQFALGKEGMKMPKLNWARNLLAKFQKGGKLGQPGIESNVIVEGAYHAHKNHLNEINPELSDMTPKGIPVATEDPDGVKTQVAEIEVGELILTKELTEKLEALYKDGSDEAAIQAGMLFAEEIIDNTVDNKGGVIDADNI